MIIASLERVHRITLDELPVEIRPAQMADLEPMLVLQGEAFADKFQAAFGRRGRARGLAALLATHRAQGSTSLQGMHVAIANQRLIGTITMRTTDMRIDDSGLIEQTFMRELGTWGTFRATHALSQLDHRISRHEGYLTDVAVTAEFRRRGVAAAMLNYVADLARRQQKHFLGLYVSASNTAARTLYYSWGFREQHTRISWWNGWMIGERRWIYMTSPIL